MVDARREEDRGFEAVKGGRRGERREMERKRGRSVFERKIKILPIILIFSLLKRKKSSLLLSPLSSSRVALRAR